MCAVVEFIGIASDPEPLAPLATSSLPEQVADRIVEAIARQRIQSGERLVETELADALGVSRVPIREATRILASQGIVQASPRRGMRVTDFDEKWAIQLHNVRVAIERLAARMVAERLHADPGLVQQLNERIADIERAAQHPTPGWLAINKADIAFHAKVFELAASPLLSTLWSAIARHVLIMYAIETYRDHDFQRVAAEHYAYRDALLSGSATMLDDEIERHVAGARIYAGVLPPVQPEHKS